MSGDEGSPSAEGEVLKQEGDLFLAVFVRVLNNISRPEQRFSFDITLVVDGAFITGTLVSGSEWTEAMAAKIRRDTAGQPGGELGDTLAGAFDRFRHEVYESTNREDVPIGYLHLLNAWPVPAVGDVMTGEGFALRVRFDRVSAWTFGRPSSVRTR